MTDVDQLKAKLHALEVERDLLFAQLPMFSLIADDHESRKIRITAQIKRLKAKIHHLEHPYA